MRTTGILIVLIITGINLSQAQDRPLAIKDDKFIETEDKILLWGGSDPSQHFDITNLDLKHDQFHYGIGREAFPALIEPKFISVAEAETMFEPEDRFLFVEFQGVRRAYSVKDLIRHEVVNDEVDGRPIMAAYCILADLGAVYDRNIGDLEFTFALSGYTYFDPEVWDGMDGFVMWDRETESLWWPLIGKAVSGPLKGVELPLMEDKFWKQTTWQDIVQNHPDTDVLEPNQDFERPDTWKKYEKVDVNPSGKPAIAPKWGGNERLRPR